ncbi:Solute carrier family 35 member F6 [Acipenser ruthenus]|uniref:Solute carrier family 35 member F6 n=1 Tax=Acipenser ruthenus TaxID=7906 RepID=A0A444UI82_ACIRT|nr:Solute carrier family 35 member F6 [Acipenser ruthenus]
MQTSSVALNMTSASSFQMLRGAVIVFTGLLSVAFLGRKLMVSQWIGIFITITGLLVVGLADFVSGEKDEKHKLSEVITGDLLIIMAQIIAAVQMVLEEKFVYKHDVHPLRAVGTEGFFGFVILSLLLIPMYYIPAGHFGNNPRQVLEDSLDAFCQIGNQPMIVLALLGNIISIAFFNFAGISVTKEMSATTRMVLDSLRTVVIWAVSLAVGWERFNGLQVLGFIVLLVGAALYNGLHKPVMEKIPCCARFLGQSSEGEGLLSENTASSAYSHSFPMNIANLFSWYNSESVSTQGVVPSAGSTASVSPIKSSGLEFFYKVIADEVTQEAAKVFEILKIETLVTGKTFGAEITFLDKLSQNLRSMGIAIQKQACDYNSDKVLLLFCPIISRIGTDIDAVIQNISSYKKVILVVMHHTRKNVSSESSRLVNKSNVLETVDCLYYETDGLYNCDANAQAITSVVSALLRYQKTM